MPAGFNNQPPAAQTLADNIIGGNIGGILSTRPSAKYITGARCTIKINGNLVGFAFSISWNINTSVTEITTVDDPFPYEFAPKRVNVDGTIGMLHIPTQSPGPNMYQPDVLSFLFNKYITIEARDARTNQLLFFTDKAMITNRQESVTAEQIATIQLQWKAIGFLDERTPQAPTSYNQANPNSPVVGGTNITNNAAPTSLINPSTVSGILNIG